MDLIGKVFVIVIVSVVLLSIALLVRGNTTSTGQKALNQSGATQLVLSDLQQNHPNATISVVSVTPSASYKDSWSIVVSFAYNATRACPTYLTEAFDYPAAGLAPTTFSIFTQGNQFNCMVLGYSNSTASGYQINVPAVAIARSYSANIPSIVSYVGTFSYNRTAVSTKYYSSLNSTATPLGKGLTSVWLVNYTAPAANFNQYVIVNQSGHIVGNYTIMKGH